MRRWLAALVAVAGASVLGADSSAQPVTNGLADPDDPAVIALVNASDELVCTAAMIAPHTAITAAHCVAGDPTKLRAFVGSAVRDGGTFIAITDAKQHPLFDPGGNDVALATLADPAPVTPVALAAPLDGSFVGTNLRVVGFGVTSPSLGGSGIKRFGNARVAALGAEDFFAVPDPSLSCLGDSGGPALVDNAIAGVVSRVDSLCVDHAVYTRIDIAQDLLIGPYLAETAEGAAHEGEPCFYDGHCAAGLACRGDGERFCESDAGCGCRGSADPSLWLVVVVGFASRRRRRRAKVT